MKNANEVAYIQSLSNSGDVRRFVILASDYIEKQIEARLAMDENTITSNFSNLKLRLEDVFYSAFITENVKGRKVVVGWKDAVGKKSYQKLVEEVPEELSGKTWSELFSVISKITLGCTSEQAMNALHVQMLEALRKYTESKGYFWHTFGGVRLDWINRREEVVIGWTRRGP